jgi:glycine/D-amino acid oxidase-like deaminating enzyme
MPASAWDIGNWRTLPTLTTDIAADVCVVGLGGSGLAAIETALAMGKSVVGIDRADVGAGAAGRNGGFLLGGGAPFHHDAVADWGRQRAVALYRETLAELERVSLQFPAMVRRTGSLRIASDAAELADCEAHRLAMLADDLPVEQYSGREGDGLLFPLDGSFDPLTTCRTHADQLLAQGAALYRATEAIELATNLVTTPHAKVRCDVTIVTVDGNLERLLPELAPQVRTARLQMLGTTPTTEVSLPRPVYFRYGYDYWQQLEDGRVIVGGLRDQGGEKEWTGIALPDDDVQSRLEQLLREQVGVKRAEVTQRWAGAVGYTPDGRPVVGEIRPGVWAAGAYSGTGNLVGRIAGRGVTRWALSGSDAGIRGILT